MILGGRCPRGRGLVAVGTLRIGRLMGCRLGLGILSNELATVTGRTLGQAGVIHCRWRPAQEIAALVASVAGPGYRNMPGRFGESPLCRISATMAGRTRHTSCRGMVHLGRLEGNANAMARVARAGGRNVRGRFTQGIHIVVAIGTRLALSRCRGMTEAYCRPVQVARAMTGFATGAGLDMGLRPGLGILGDKSAIVAGDASCPTSNAMIHGSRLEGREVVVAAITLGCRRNMLRRLAQRSRAMTSTAFAGGSRFMGVFNRGPRRGAAMTAIALFCRGDMGNRLDLGILRDVAAIVTGQALAAQAGMVHDCRRPDLEAGGMAGITLCRRLDMTIRFGLRVG